MCRVIMQLNNVYIRFLSACIIISFIITCFISLLPIPSSKGMRFRVVIISINLKVELLFHCFQTVVIVNQNLVSKPNMFTAMIIKSKAINRNWPFSCHFAIDSMSCLNSHRIWQHFSIDRMYRITFLCSIKSTFIDSIGLHWSMLVFCTRKQITITLQCTTSTCCQWMIICDTIIQEMDHFT